MAGSNASFDPALFRESVRFAMRMGAPSQTSQRVTFRWSDTATYAIADRANRPYEWDATPVTENHIADMQVDCAVEFSGGETIAGTSVGDFNSARIIITLLDTDYDALLTGGGGRFPDLVRADEAIYEVRFIAPPIGLFDVTVYQVHCTARSEN